MQFSVAREKLSKILLIISHQVLPKPALPVLANILLEAEKDSLKISATNLELGLSLTLEAKVKKMGKITLPAKILTDFISQLTKPEVNFRLLNSEMLVESGRSTAKIPTIPPDEYPVIPKLAPTPTTIDGAKLTATLGRLTFAASADSGRPTLTGVLVEFSPKNLKLVATDGYRLSFESISLDKGFGEQALIIPAKTLTQLARIISEEGGLVKILFDPTINQIGFEVGRTYLVSRLIDGTFPDWQKIIPAAFKTKAQVATTELAQAVKVASVFAKESTNAVRLNFAEDIKIQALSGAGESTTIIPAQVTGEKLEIAFNWRYLLEILAVIPAEGQLEINLVESLAPAKLTPVGGKVDFFHIIMPIRIS